ncbi:UNVERIFIED_CONTAM: acyl-CoA thioester hydrolase [Acetivibrio alkalicellulosi]
MFITETLLVVRYAETDQMGVVHHSNYPIWFELARTEYIKNLGMSYSQIEKRGFLLPLIELNCKYKSAARYEDELIVRTSVKELTFTRLIFHYEASKKIDNSLVSIGETTHVWTDKNLKPLNIKKHAPDIYQLLGQGDKVPIP